MRARLEGTKLHLDANEFRSGASGELIEWTMTNGEQELNAHITAAARKKLSSPVSAKHNPPPPTPITALAVLPPPTPHPAPPSTTQGKGISLNLTEDHAESIRLRQVLKFGLTNHARAMGIKTEINEGDVEHKIIADDNVPSITDASQMQGKLLSPRLVEIKFPANELALQVCDAIAKSPGWKDVYWCKFVQLTAEQEAHLASPSTEEKLLTEAQELQMQRRMDLARKRMILDKKSARKRLLSQYLTRVKSTPEGKPKHQRTAPYKPSTRLNQLTNQPDVQISKQPTDQTSQPTRQPANQLSNKPTNQPTNQQTGQPTNSAYGPIHKTPGPGGKYPSFFFV